MGATHYSLPLPPKSNSPLFASPKVEPEKICVVVPVYNDWTGLKTTLESLQELNPRPGDITVANDNVDGCIPAWLSKTFPVPVNIVNYRGNRGPAYARNRGCAGISPGFDWFYFTDCGCEHVVDLISSLICAREKSEDSVVAICGTVSGKGSGKINRYMTEMNILNPPFEKHLNSSGQKVPQTIITANALVYTHAFHQIRGFSTDFREAGGEDLDLGIRLRDIGELVYQPDAAVVHEFDEDSKDFRRRFERYGRGNRLFEQKHNLPSLRPLPKSLPQVLGNGEFRDLIKLQRKSLRRGYNQSRVREFKVIAELESIVSLSTNVLKRSILGKVVAYR